MKPSALRTLAGLVITAAGIVGMRQVTTAVAEPVAESDFKTAVEQDSKNILDAVNRVTTAKVEAKKGASSNASRAIQCNAMMIALFAQSQITGKNVAQDAAMATLRDSAIKVALLGSAKKFTEVAEPAKALGTLKADPNAKAAMSVADLAKAGQLDVEILMHQLKSTVVGGYGIEEQIQDLGDPDAKETITPEAAKRMAVRLHAIADYFEVLEPAKGFTKAPKSAWAGFAKDMKTATSEMVAAANAKDPKKIKAAFMKLDASCIACHAKFK